MESLFEELGIPKRYIKRTGREDRFVVIVHRKWLKALVKHSELREFIEKSRTDTWSYAEEEVGYCWTKVIVQIFKKRDLKVLPLPRIRTNLQDDPPLLFSQLMQYISQTNYKNLWKEAYKKYSGNVESSKNVQILLADYNEVLREVIERTYGCCIINTLDNTQNIDISKQFDPNLNIFPVVCSVETLNAIFLFHIPYMGHNVTDCVTFSPAILEKCFTKPLFIVYQILQTLKSLHDRSLTLGDITLSDIYISDDLWVQIFPRLNSNIHIQDIPKSDVKKTLNTYDCRRVGHKFNSSLKCEYCGLKTYDKHQVTNESLEKLCQLWVDGQISNFTYLTALNNFAGRKVGDPNCHHVFPWVTDFASRCGKNWRDLKRSKYRLNKGDRQLDLQYENSSSQIPHHVSDVLSAITYYVYMARRTPKSTLCKHVRTVWVPAEYPSSIQRLQEWTPDECIPEFFNDPTVFKSIHDDLDDLEVPPWSSSPEDFVEKHREALESYHVSERLHQWIDLTFGYKLAGNAAVKAKNVCLHLVDEHDNLTKSGIVQLFTRPHPPRTINSVFYGKVPPKIFFQKTLGHKARDRSQSSGQEQFRSDEEEIAFDNPCSSQSTSRSPLVLSHFLSRSRNSLNEDQNNQKLSRSPSNQRSNSLGPKNPSFTSHVSIKSKPSNLPVVNSAVINLPKEYKPEAVLENLEKLHEFFSKTFYTEQGEKITGEETENLKKDSEEFVVQNAFTNQMFMESFEAKFRKSIATKSYTFPIDNQNILQYRTKGTTNTKKENQITCNYSEIISARRVRELQVLGCLLIELFMFRQLRCLNGNDINKVTFKQRLKACLTVARTYKYDIPPCIRYLVLLLLNPDSCDIDGFKYPPVTDLGLPPPSAHLLLEPLLHRVIAFPRHFLNIYSLLSSLKRFESVAEELNVLYYFECNGQMCVEYENIERTRLLLAQNIGECKVKLCARNLEALLNDLNTSTELEIVYIMLPHIKDLIEDPPTSILAAWYLLDPISRVLGPRKTRETLLQSIIKLYENELNENAVFFNNKIVKLYHHSFLLCLIVRLGLKCFLENFITPLVEAVGGYRDYDQIDFMFHTHSVKIIRKPSNLKSMATEQHDISQEEDLSSDSEKHENTPSPKKRLASSKQEEVFEFEPEEPQDDAIKSLIAHLELNVEQDLPFDHSTAEEALDATLSENIDHLRNLEELNLNLDDNPEHSGGNLMSPTIPIPSSYKQFELSNISCDVGSKKSENESYLDKDSNQSHFEIDFDSASAGGSRKSTDNPHSASSGSTSYSESKSKTKNTRNDAKISDMSADSLVWLSHRLGPVLTARYLSRSLLRMLTLCYVGKESLVFVPSETSTDINGISIASSRVVGDHDANKVLECLANIAALYGEQLILVQYLPHMSELISLCKRRLTQNLEAGLISCLTLLKYIIPFISDSSLMDQLQDVILKNILHPIIRLLGSTKYSFPNGSVARNVLARKYLDTMYILSLRIGADMTRTQLVVPGLQRFFLIFDKIKTTDSYAFNENFDNKGSPLLKDDSNVAKSLEESHYIEVCRDGTTAEWAISGRPIQISHVRLKDAESMDSLSPPPTQQLIENVNSNSILNKALEELTYVFTAELAYKAYIPLLKQIGVSSMESCLKNYMTIQQLCQEYELEMNIVNQKVSVGSEMFATETISSSGSIGSNIALIGNRIDVQTENQDTQATDVLKLVSNRMENESRHLRGNWLAYWEHEIGRSDKDNQFNFKQIKLQTFAGHTQSVKSLYVLDNENSFISGGRDKTVKLWSLRSQGDGGTISNCQWTYTAHRKSILAIAFIESLRLAASCDSVVHIWDPFLGVNVGYLESPKYAPVNVLKSMPPPSTQMFAATTDGTVKIVDARLCTYVHELKVSLGPAGLIRCIAISPSGLWMATGQSSGQITVLDTRTGLVISTWCAHQSEVLQLVAVGEDSLISSSLDQTVSVWNVQDGKFKFHMRGATEPVHCLNVYNSELISGTTANRIGVHTAIEADASFSTTKLRSDAFKGLLTSMAVLPLNRLLLLGADSGNIVLLC